jgi:predicted deacetylase
MIDGCGEVPVTLLVVPDYHHRGRIAEDAGFRHAIEARLARGDELALHGLHHLDDSARPPRGPRQWAMRRLYTATEGEFAGLDEGTAERHLQAGLAQFTELDWPVRGFVAPAWLMSAGTRAALSRSAFAYTSTRRALYALPEWREFAYPSLVWSVRSAWRRGASRVVNELQSRRLRRAPLLRLGLHPADAAHPAAVTFWRDSLRQALNTRTPLTKSAWLKKTLEGSA